MRDAAFGAVCMVQRWGGSANLNLHLHALVADGVFVENAAAAASSTTVTFHALPAPEKGVVSAVAWAVCQRVEEIGRASCRERV